MFSSPNNTFSRTNQPTELNFSQISSIGEPIDQSTPAFLFGGKRKPANAANSSFSGAAAPSSDIFASPAPTGTAPKSVHWSPALVQQQNQLKSLVGSSNSGSTPNTTTTSTKAPPSSLAGHQMLNAPPLRSLRDQIEPAKKLARRNTFAARTTTPLAQRSAPSTTSTEQQNDATSAAQDPQDVADTWVTVFGFQSAQIPAILNLFSRHGEVVSHQAPANVNFVHIRYSCVTHAHQALSRNSTLFDQNTLIGVVPCTNKDVINGTASGIVLRSTSSNGLANSSFSSGVPANRSIYQSMIEEEPENQHNRSALLNASSQFDTSLNSSRLSVRSGVGMRPLAADQRFNAENANAAKNQQDGFLNKLWTSIGL